MKTLIGIDPGVNTGLAVYSEEKLQLVESCTAVNAESFVLKTMKEGENIKLYIEDARKRKYFGNTGRERLQGAGSIKRDSLRWQEFSEHHKIEFELIAPKDNKTKLKSAEFKKLTGWNGRTNHNSRDAAMLIFGR